MQGTSIQSEASVAFTTQVASPVS